MFHKTVETYPDRAAVKYGAVCLTYSDLNQRVDELGVALKNNYNVGKGDRVAIFLKNDCTFPSAFLAISKLGAVSVVLNTRLAKPELAYQLELTKPVVAIVDGETWDKSLDDLVKFKVESSSLAHLWGKGGVCPPAAASEDDCHTILFTSGTTGKPKGVRIVHRNFIHSAIRLEQYMEMLGVRDPETERKTLIIAPLFHVMALQEQFMPSMRMASTTDV
jgi:acyl-CoA synthetase (AMP-forming)/AMP-acid ligase II